MAGRKDEMNQIYKVGIQLEPFAQAVNRIAMFNPIAEGNGCDRG